MKDGKYVNQAGTSWFKNDLLHREEGPAIIWHDGKREWFLHGQRHREDGPAIELYKQSYFEWHVNGQNLTEEEFNQWCMKKELNEKLHSTLAPKHHEKKKKI